MKGSGLNAMRCDAMDAMQRPFAAPSPNPPPHAGEGE